MPALIPQQAWTEKAHTPWSLRLAPFTAFLLIISLVTLADSQMAYLTPVFVESQVPNQSSMGLIVAFSSVIGLLCDLTFPRFFRHKKPLFFLALTLLVAFLFPLTLIFLPPIVPFFLLATGLWGVYYEALNFSNFSFINMTTPLKQHAHAWGMVTMVKSLSWTIGPLLASVLLLEGYDSVFGIVILLLCTATTLALLHKRQLTKSSATIPSKTHVQSVGTQARVWLTLLRKVWPLFFFLFLLWVVDAAFWTIGVLLAEDLKSISVWGVVLLSAYALPTVLFSGFAAKAAKPFGKKRIALLLGIFSGLSLIIMGLVKSPQLIVGSVFLYGCISAIIWPEIFATFENYVARLHEHGIDMIGLQSSAGSLSYIVGPVIAGILAATVGNQLTFSFFGITLLLSSVGLLLIVPKKIHMPQHELELIEAGKVQP